MTESVVIRPPNYDERKHFFQVYNTGLPFVDETTPKKFEMSWERSAKDGRLEKLWRVALVDNRIVGVAVNIVNVPLRWGMIWELAVIPEMRSKGVGRRLIAESERILVEQKPKVKYLALGVKTENLRAIALYERLGYGIRNVALRMRGNVWKPKRVSDVVVQTPELQHVPELRELLPDAYWSSCSPSGWKAAIRDKNAHVFRSKTAKKVVGFARIAPEEENPAITGISFHVRPGFGQPFLESVIGTVKTPIVDLWVQDNHQDMINHLFGRGLKRKESEFLMIKELPKTAS